METPDDRKYSETHEWVELEDDMAVVGLSDYAQAELGDITFVELPEVGDVVSQNDECGVVESVKAASDLFAPISGEIAEVNRDLEEKPEAINEDPYGDGWIFKLKDVDETQYEALLEADEYVASQK